MSQDHEFILAQMEKVRSLLDVLERECAYNTESLELFVKLKTELQVAISLLREMSAGIL